MRLVAESGADLVLNAIVGSAGLGPTIVALTEGIDVALANKESLVVGGELVMALCEATGAQLIPVDSEHSALHQLIDGERPGTIDRLDAHRVGRPVPRPHARRARGRHRRGGARAPDLGDGRQDHDRLGDADEQGPRGDRGALAVRHAVRPDRRRRAPAVDRPRARRACATARRSRTSATPTCACRSPTRCTIPSASTCRCATLDLAEVGALTFEPPDLDAFPCLRLAREAARGRRHRAVRAQRRQRGRRARVPRRPARLPRHPRGDRDDARAAARRSACTRSRRSTTPTPRRARRRRRGDRRCRA